MIRNLVSCNFIPVLCDLLDLAGLGSWFCLFAGWAVSTSGQAQSLLHTKCQVQRPASTEEKGLERAQEQQVSGWCQQLGGRRKRFTHEVSKKTQTKPATVATQLPAYPLSKPFSLCAGIHPSHGVFFAKP